ncbi:MAG: oxidoreductase [Proteobacteria bacterium]|nr:MAG: oxidoreductase [Pseudomonadota bacterium]
MSQHQEKATIIRVRQLSDTHFRMTVHAPSIAAASRPGQFVMIRVGVGREPLLRRPFSIHQTSGNGHLQIYFRKIGKGTALLAQLKPEEEIDLFGPLGHGFDISAVKPACLVGGGLGIAPLLFLAKEICRIKKDVSRDIIVLGGRNRDELEPLVRDFEQFGLKIYCTTDNGSYGEKGFVTQILQPEKIPDGALLYSCGPEPMLERVHELCENNGWDCQVSVESVMACGMGACLGCNVPARDGRYLHVCIDGPVFNARELLWNS